MRILTFTGKHIHSLDDIYAFIKKELHLDETFGNNLDALYDVLCDGDFSQIIITENYLLKDNLSHPYKEGLTEYMLFLDVLTDLDGVEIILK